MAAIRAGITTTPADKRTTRGSTMSVVMWEARAAAGRADELLVWVLEHADPSADVYRSADERIVVIGPGGHGLDDAPAALLARPPHAWPFERVR